MQKARSVPRYFVSAKNWPTNFSLLKQQSRPCIIVGHDIIQYKYKYKCKYYTLYLLHTQELLRQFSRLSLLSLFPYTLSPIYHTSRDTFVLLLQELHLLRYLVLFFPSCLCRLLSHSDVVTLQMMGRLLTTLHCKLKHLFIVYLENMRTW